jgi:hypothetical protein
MHINPSTQSVIAEDDVQENEVDKENVEKSAKGENDNVCRYENSWRHGRSARVSWNNPILNFEFFPPLILNYIPPRALHINFQVPSYTLAIPTGYSLFPLKIQRILRIF